MVAFISVWGIRWMERWPPEPTGAAVTKIAASFQKCDVHIPPCVKFTSPAVQRIPPPDVLQPLLEPVVSPGVSSVGVPTVPTRDPATPGELV